MDDVLFFHQGDPKKPRFQGDVKNGRMEGRGKFFFENGNVYEGEFLNNQFHGQGTITFPGSGKYEATWVFGKASDGKYTFGDGLGYQEKDWKYCTPEDRRYRTEREDGIRPAGHDQLTDSRGFRELPRGCYDVGDGYLNPVDNLVYQYRTSANGATKALRPAEDGELAWAKEKCRVGGDNAPVAEREDEVAAKTIQSRYKANRARKELDEVKKGAQSIQANYRGWKSRHTMKQKADAQKDEEEQAEAATLMQSRFRGNQERAAAAAEAAAELDSDEEPAEAPVDMDDPDLDAVRPASKMRLGLC